MFLNSSAGRVSSAAQPKNPDVRLFASVWLAKKVSGTLLSDAQLLKMLPRLVRAGMSASSPAGTLSSALQPLNRPDAEVAFVVFSKSFSGTLFSAVQL